MGGSSFAVVAMSALTFRGVRYESSAGSSHYEPSLKKLVYRRFAEGESLIRSGKTAALLKLDPSSGEVTKLVYRGVPVRHISISRIDKAPIQVGGFIRSRMTAELIGINPVESLKASSTSVRIGGIIRSRTTAELLGLDCSKSERFRVYRGVVY